MYAKYIKRILDFTLSLIGLILLSPVFLVVAILVRVKLGSPILFTQERPGKNEKIFKMVKFRTMSDTRDAQGNLLPDSERLTKFGKTLRSTSLDELPELFNILKGDMSIVGPRPLLVKYLPYYTEEEHHRHDVRPGLTGWAQIHGRNLCSWESRFQYDLEYVEHLSFLFEIKILLKTIKKVICQDDVVVHENNPMQSLDKERSNKERIKER